MTPERFQQIRNIFEAALERDAAARSAYVAEACRNDSELRAEVCRLLDAHDATVTLLAPAPASRTDPVSREGRRLGDYELLRELGRGGMGSVYLARRADDAFHKHVAIKILRADAASPDVVQRFHREREILAALDHPNIARLLDAGKTEDGLPYFVMEYAEGQSITQYADEQRLPVSKRLALFRQVCDAVEYAHRRKIVHRDLKPSNVLVTAEGQVKLLDFGIARLLEQDAGPAGLTRSGMWLMTPEYASPEQVRGEVAGRESDVYSLGVILFELLTGHRPYQLKSRIFNEIVRVVCEEPPTRPSTVIEQPVESTTADGKPATLPAETAGRLRQISLDELKEQLSGDLDNIVLKALQKQPQDRYASPQQLGADLDRHARGEAVWARRDAFLYRAGKAVSRYAAPLIILAAVVAAIASGSVKVSAGALWWLGGAAALIGVWVAATNRRIGERIGGLLVSAPIALVYMATSSGDRAYGVQITILGIFALFAGVNLAIWLTRRWWSGPLLLDIRIVQPSQLRNFRLFVTCLLLLLLYVAYPSDRGNLDARWLLFWSLFFFSVATMLALFGRLEIRRDGLLRGLGFGLIRWSRIASWAWDGDTLILNLHRRIHFLPPVRIGVSEGWGWHFKATPWKDRLEAVLTRQLGEWPGQRAYSANAASPVRTGIRSRSYWMLIGMIIGMGIRELNSARNGAPAAARPATAVQSPWIDSNDPVSRAAREATFTFHNQYSRRQFHDACEMTESGAFPLSIMARSCDKFLDREYMRLGPIVAARPNQYASIHPASPGVRIEITYAVHFEKGDALEYFTWLISGGQPKLISYRTGTLLSPPRWRDSDRFPH